MARTETSPARSAGVSLGVARKKTKPGLAGAGGRYVPTSTSRAWAGGSGALDSTALSAAPSTNSLLWLATATRGGGRGTASWTVDGAPCSEEVQRDMTVGTGSRSEVKSGEKTDEAILGAKRRAEQLVFPRHERLIHTTRRERPRYFGAHWTQAQEDVLPRGSAASSRQRVQDKIKLPGTGSGVRPSGRE